MAKHKHSPCQLTETPTWLKIRNYDYSQWGRQELVEREQETSPWASCVARCAAPETRELMQRE